MRESTPRLPGEPYPIAVDVPFLARDCSPALGLAADIVVAERVATLAKPPPTSTPLAPSPRRSRVLGTASGTMRARARVTNGMTAPRSSPSTSACGTTQSTLPGCRTRTPVGPTPWECLRASPRSTTVSRRATHSRTPELHGHRLRLGTRKRPSGGHPHALGGWPGRSRGARESLPGDHGAGCRRAASPA